jgi:hypothetical protein
MDSSPRLPRRGFPRGGVAILILIVATGTTFCPLVRAQFTSWDDYETVARNPLLNPPTRQSLAAFWTRPHGDLYIPVTYMVWAGVAAISGGGGSGNATGFHLFNVVLHAVAAILAYGVLEVLTKHRAAALIGALLFALHPVQVESVAWVSGMKDVLFGVFALAAIYAYLRFATCEPARAKRQWQLHYAVATMVFVLAMLAKPTAMMLPLVIIVLDRVMLGRPMRAVLGATWPWLLLAVPCAVATKMFQPAQHAADAAAPLWARPLVAADALAFYLYKLIWPAKLTFDYGRTPQVVRDSGQLAWTWVAPVIVAAAAWWAWRRGTRAVAAGLMVMVIVLLPVLGLVPFDFQVYSTVADHYLYLAMLGPALIVAWLLSRRPTIPVLVTAACVVALCGVRSFAQAKHWQNSHALFTHALDVNPRSFAAYSHLASMANEANRPAEAIALIKRAIDIRPDAARYAIYAEALRRKGDTAGAMSAYREALRQDENYATALANLAVMLAEAGRLDEAIPLARRAVEVEPHVAQNRFNLALMYLNDNQPELARRELEAVLRSDPNHSGARELMKQGAARST